MRVKGGNSGQALPHPAFSWLPVGTFLPLGFSPSTAFAFLQAPCDFSPYTHPAGSGVPALMCGMPQQCQPSERSDMGMSPPCDAPSGSKERGVGTSSHRKHLLFSKAAKYLVPGCPGLVISDVVTARRSAQTHPLERDTLSWGQTLALLFTSL